LVLVVVVVVDVVVCWVLVPEVPADAAATRCQIDPNVFSSSPWAVPFCPDIRSGVK
jgi:hypothetical protein